MALQSKSQRPLLRYFGGKWSLAQWIIDHFPPHKIYVEPFGGAASVLIRKEPSHSEIYNDLDDRLVNLFRVLKDETKFEQLLRNLRYTLYSRAEYESAFDPSTTDVEDAEKLIVQSWMGFGSTSAFEKTGLRGNVKSVSTVPQKGWVSYVENLPNIFERLRYVLIERSSYKDVVSAYDSDHTLFYVDPPYVLSTRSRAAYRHELTDSEHVELADVLNNVAGMVVLSGYASDLYKELYAGWQYVEREHFADAGRRKRTVRTEGLWLNAASQRAIAQRRPRLL